MQVFHTQYWQTCQNCLTEKNSIVVLEDEGSTGPSTAAVPSVMIDHN